MKFARCKIGPVVGRWQRCPVLFLLPVLLAACGMASSPAPGPLNGYPAATPASSGTPSPAILTVPMPSDSATPTTTVSHTSVPPTFPSQPTSPTSTNSLASSATPLASAPLLSSRTPLPTPRPVGTIFFTTSSEQIFMIDASCVRSVTGCFTGWTRLLDNRNGGGRSLASDLTASPDGKYLAFTLLEHDESGRMQRSSIHILDVEKCRSLPSGCQVDQTFQLIGDLIQDTWGPAWSPTEDVIAFMLDSGAYLGLASMAITGSTYERLFEADQIASDANLGNPVWSADGQRLAFVATYGGERHADTYICTINKDGTGFKQLMNFPHEEPYEKHNFYPYWSPDNRKIVFASNHRHEGWKEDYSYYLYTMNADGSGITPLGVEGLFAVWSPDGNQILYTNDALYVVDAKGGTPKQLTRSGSYIMAVIWVP